MPSFILNNLIASDPPGDPASVPAFTFPNPGATGVPAPILDNLPICDHINIDVMNASVYWASKEVTGNTSLDRLGTWQQFVFMPPGSRTIYNRGGGLVGFQFYAAIPAAHIPAGSFQARVTVEAVQ